MLDFPVKNKYSTCMMRLSTPWTSKYKAAIGRDLNEIARRLDGLESAPPPPPVPLADPALVAQVGDMDVLRELMSNLADRLTVSEASVQSLEDGARDLVVAVAEGIENVSRAERRVQATVRRAQKKLADLGIVDEGLEAEAGQLHEADGSGSNGERVPAVPVALEKVEPEASSIRGVPLETLRRVRGGRKW